MQATQPQRSGARLHEQTVRIGADNAPRRARRFSCSDDSNVGQTEFHELAAHLNRDTRPRKQSIDPGRERTRRRGKIEHAIFLGQLAAVGGGRVILRREAQRASRQARQRSREQRHARLRSRGGDPGKPNETDDEPGSSVTVTMNLRNGVIRDYEVKVEATRRATRARISIPVSDQRIVILTYLPISRIDVPTEAKEKLKVARTPATGRKP